MAINTTYFSLAQGKNATLVKEWFEENATDFFDEVTAASNAVTLKSNGNTIMKINLVTYNIYVEFYTKSGVTYKSSCTDTTEQTGLKWLTKTDSGIAMAFQNYANSSYTYSYSVFITKTQSGEIGCAMCKNPNSADNFKSWSFISRLTASETTSYSVSNTLLSTMTTVANAVCQNCDDYLASCYVSPFSQYAGTACTFELDGIKYLSNGYISLRD